MNADINRDSREKGATAELDDDRSRLLARALGDVVLDINLVTKEVRWTGAVESMLGYTPEQVLPSLEWWGERVHPDERPAASSLFAAAIEQGADTWSTELRFLRADGTYVSTLTRYAFLRRGGVVVRAVGTMVDNSKRTSAEKSLRDLERRHRQILDAIGDLVLVKGPGSQIIWANRAFRETYGMSNEQLQGLIDAPFVQPDLTLQYLRDDDHVFATGQTLDIADEPVQTYDGKTRRYHTVKSPILDEDGKVVMIVGISRDITDRKRMQAQLAMSERMVSIGTLAAGVAHEINNPLACVTANLELLSEQIRDGLDRARVDELSELIGDARNGAERVRRIVRSFKSFSRNEAENRKPLSIEPVLDLAITMAGNELRHRARVVKRIGAAPLVSADETQLAQVFINLLINAAHAMPEGNADANEIRVIVSTDDDGRAMIQVRDSGCGIPAESIGRIFDPFFTTKPVVGTGLGLSICQGIIHGLGGALRVESKVDLGTTCTVVLPAAAPVELLPPLRRATQAPAEGTRPGRVLIVDDDALAGRALARALEGEHDVVVVSEGRVALERIRSGERFDVVFCDVMMPVMTGAELYAELRKVAPDQVERIVMMTGGAFTATARDFLDTITNERIDKPFNVRAVRGIVRRMVQ